jgi:hypothetical protein
MEGDGRAGGDSSFSHCMAFWEGKFGLWLCISWACTVRAERRVRDLAGILYYYIVSSR